MQLFSQGIFWYTLPDYKFIYAGSSGLIDIRGKNMSKNHTARHLNLEEMEIIAQSLEEGMDFKGITTIISSTLPPSPVKYHAIRNRLKNVPITTGG